MSRPEHSATWYRRMLAEAKRRGDPCHYCGAPADTLDHVIELDRGGDHHPDNIVPACRSCNSRRGARYGNRKRRARMGRRTTPRPRATQATPRWQAEQHPPPRGG